jgi:hypothetical protein
MSQSNQIFGLVLIALLLASPIAVFGNECYDRHVVCDGTNHFVCDDRVEKAVIADAPEGLIERKGLSLTIRARNGKLVERKSTDPAKIGVQHTEAGKDRASRDQTVWACDYFPQHKFVRLCYRLWESMETEFVNTETGKTVVILGAQTYSPSGSRILSVDGYADETYSIEVWRFRKSSLIKEFRAKPNWSFWANATWVSEDDILLESRPPSGSQQYRLLRKNNKWTLRSNAVKEVR